MGQEVCVWACGRSILFTTIDTKRSRSKYTSQTEPKQKKVVSSAELLEHLACASMGGGIRRSRFEAIANQISTPSLKLAQSTNKTPVFPLAIGPIHTLALVVVVKMHLGCCCFFICFQYEIMKHFHSYIIHSLNLLKT